ncbi:MAG TPA: antitoxin VapB family protein [Candidatus Thermoplasmatota archaeon]|nr:antitoxin VapB family protein [Candidatus Thermoplasmatota archaeon]
MPSPKTIAVTEAAYRALEQLKRPGESFSDVIVRRLGGHRYREFVGCWGSLSERQFAHIEADLDAGRAASERKSARRAGRLGGR